MYTIYTKTNCIWCDKAKQLMKDLNLEYKELVLGVDYTKEQLRAIVPTDLPLTAPQIYDKTNKRIGGYEDLARYCEETGIIGALE